uniref:Axonemal dynein light chain domain containing 1 n=1 Tax=Oryzias latipes TaxID=8090 RepID=H2LXR2_ORYLA
RCRGSSMSTFSRSSSTHRSSKPKRAQDSTGEFMNISETEDAKNKKKIILIIINKLKYFFNYLLDNRAVRRPDAVWHHPLGRNKYKFFLEQPTSLTGAGRSRNRNQIFQSGGRKEGCLKKKLECWWGLNRNACAYSVFRKPSSRKEAVELMKNMDDMLEKAGVDRQNEELSQLSQVGPAPLWLTGLVKVEQNIYNTVFHELIRQVTVGCAEKGQVLAKLRQRYQALLDRIPRRLKALHTETVAQKSLGRRLTEEIHRIKSSLHRRSAEILYKNSNCELLNDWDPFLSVLQRYHELYELLRTRLEAQLLQMTEERNNWSKLTFSLALKVGNTLHFLYCGFGLQDTEDLKEIMELTDHWKDELTHVVSQLKTTERAHCAQISVVQHGINLKMQ